MLGDRLLLNVTGAPLCSAFAEDRWPRHQVSLLICYEKQQDGGRRSGESSAVVVIRHISISIGQQQ